MFIYSQQFPVILEEDENSGYVVSCPNFEGCYSQGETIEEALKNIKEVIEMCLDEVKEHKEKVLQKNISLHLVRV